VRAEHDHLDPLLGRDPYDLAGGITHGEPVRECHGLIGGPHIFQHLENPL
jgi:hypothetical protein